MRYQTKVNSPLGMLRLFADDDDLVGLYFPGHSPAPRDTSGKSDVGPFAEVLSQLQAYFERERDDFALSLRMDGTEFQQSVWKELRSIDLGTTRTYGEIAKRCGRANAVRAVGAAIARNPISIIVPCHRVLGASGKLTGFAGGLERKRWLLDREGKRVAAA